MKTAPDGYNNRNTSHLLFSPCRPPAYILRLLFQFSCTESGRAQQENSCVCWVFKHMQRNIGCSRPRTVFSEAFRLFCQMSWHPCHRVEPQYKVKHRRYFYHQGLSASLQEQRSCRSQIQMHMIFTTSYIYIACCIDYNFVYSQWKSSKDENFHFFPPNLLEPVIAIVKPLSEPPLNIDFETFLIYSLGLSRKRVCNYPALGPDSYCFIDCSSSFICGENYPRNTVSLSFFSDTLF